MRQLILILCLTVIPLFPSLSAGQEKSMPAEYTDPVTGMQFVSIPGGTFVMGNDHDPFARPAHEVTVKPFFMGKYEVTFAQYDKFCQETGRDKPDDSGWGRGIRPVINVSWHDATAFTEWLSKKTGRAFRLPTEAEWEYAARGGKQSHFAWGNEFGRGNANCDGCGSPWDGRQTAAVGSFSSNPYGLYDMTGNVYEWCLDAKHRSYNGARTDGSAWMADGVVDHRNRESRINRGGSWFQPADEMPVHRRCWDPVDMRRDELGFRVLMEP